MTNPEIDAQVIGEITWKDYKTIVFETSERVIAHEHERFIKLINAEMERIRLWPDYPATNALANVRGALIKGEGK